jgi:hypothetical protein
LWPRELSLTGNEAVRGDEGTRPARGSSSTLYTTPLLRMGFTLIILHVYNKDVEDYNKDVEDYNKDVEDYNKDVEDYNKDVEDKKRF